MASRSENVDAAFWPLFCQRIEHGSERDPLLHMISLASVAQDLNKAGRLDEFRGRTLRTLATLGRRAQVEILTSSEG